MLTVVTFVILPANEQIPPPPDPSRQNSSKSLIRLGGRHSTVTLSSASWLTCYGQGSSRSSFSTCPIGSVTSSSRLERYAKSSLGVEEASLMALHNSLKR